MQPLIKHQPTQIVLLIEHALRGDVNGRFTVMFILGEWILRQKNSFFLLQPGHNKEFLLVSGRWSCFKPSQMQTSSRTPLLKSCSVVSPQEFQCSTTKTCSNSEIFQLLFTDLGEAKSLMFVCLQHFSLHEGVLHLLH